MGASASVAVAFVGKLKTAAQMSAIPLLLFRLQFRGFDSIKLGTLLIYVAAVLCPVVDGLLHALCLARADEAQSLKKLQTGKFDVPFI